MLVKNIYVSPTAAEWFYDLVVRVFEVYAFRGYIHQSDLKMKPVFLLLYFFDSLRI